MSWFQNLSVKMKTCEEEERRAVMALIQRYVDTVVRNGLLVKFVYVPRNQIMTADALSRGDNGTITRLMSDGMERVRV